MTNTENATAPAATDAPAVVEYFTEVLISQLREGDLVHSYGMRIRLGALRTYPGTYGTTYAFDGTVENADELRAQAGGHVTDGLLRSDNRWTVQSNDNARWSRIDATPAVPAILTGNLRPAGRYGAQLVAGTEVLVGITPDGADWPVVADGITYRVAPAEVLAATAV